MKGEHAVLAASIVVASILLLVILGVLALAVLLDPIPQEQAQSLARIVPIHESPAPAAGETRE